MPRCYDTGKKIEKYRKTVRGTLLVEAFPTRTGVLNYLRNGTVRRELRPPEELVKVLDQIAHAPLVSEHKTFSPTQADHLEGLTQGEVILQDDGWVRTKVHVLLDKAIKDIEGNRRRQLSGGFDEVRFDASPGFWDATSQTYQLDGQTAPSGFERGRAERFDGIQRDLVYNHTMLCRVGRAGPQASVAYDGYEVHDMIEEEGGLFFVVSEEGKRLSRGYSSREEATERLREIEHFKSQETRRDAMPRKITIDGEVYEVENEVATAFRDELKRFKQRADSAEAENQTLKGQVTQLTTERDTEKGRADALQATKTKAHDSSDVKALNERVEVILRGRQLGLEYLQEKPFSCEKPTSEIRRDCVAAAYDSLDVKSVSEAEVIGMYKVLSTREPAFDEVQFEDVREVLEPVTKKAKRGRSDENDLESAYDAFFENATTKQTRKQPSPN